MKKKKVMATLLFVMSFVRVCFGTYEEHLFRHHHRFVISFETWCEWDIALMACCGVAIITTIILIVGLHLEYFKCVIIWLITFTALMTFDVITECSVIIYHGFEQEVRTGRLIFFVLIDSFIYFELILFSYYRIVKKERENQIIDLAGTSPSTLIRVETRLRERLHQEETTQQRLLLH